MPNDTDPNEATEPKGDITRPKESMEQLYPQTELPIKETPTPFRNVRDGGGSSGA